jgi:hypothetical protein
MQLIYRISSVYLYDNQLDHDYFFFYNRKLNYSKELSWDAPYMMFGGSAYSASTRIYNMDKKDPDFINKSINIMKEAAKQEKTEIIENKDFITLIPCGESRISYSKFILPGDIVETEGKYKGYKKQTYTPYDVMFNETKSGINPHEFDVMGIWNKGKANYSGYRLWENISEREKSIRDIKLKHLLDN